MSTNTPVKPRTARPKSQYKNIKDVVVDQTLLDKGKLINDVRNSDDIYQAVKDRLCLWPTGDEIISLLMLIQSDQISQSYRPSAFDPQTVLPTVIADATEDLTMNSRKSKTNI
ncbi:hypothetical protein Btru_035630 [Bulinus truncatus]|nr:hypothetical protein Btru_035630 [Bulinus truncatus]